MDGTEAGTIELKDEIFGIEVNQYAVHAVVKNYLANQRQGTQSAKTRAEVRGGGRKPFRQKGTRSRKTGQLDIAKPHRRRHRVRSQTERLQIQPAQETQKAGNENRLFPRR